MCATSRARLHPLSNHGGRQDGGGGGPITCLVVRLRGSLAHQLGAAVLHRVLQLHLLGDCDAVVHYLGHAKLGLEHDVAALRPQRHANDGGELVHPSLHLLQRPAQA